MSACSFSNGCNDVLSPGRPSLMAEQLPGHSANNQPGPLPSKWLGAKPNGYVLCFDSAKGHAVSIPAYEQLKAQKSL